MFFWKYLKYRGRIHGIESPLAGSSTVFPERHLEFGEIFGVSAGSQSLGLGPWNVEKPLRSLLGTLKSRNQLASQVLRKRPQSYLSQQAEQVNPHRCPGG